MPLVDYDILEWLGVCELSYSEILDLLSRKIKFLLFCVCNNLKLGYVKNTL